MNPVAQVKQIQNSILVNQVISYPFGIQNIKSKKHSTQQCMNSNIVYEYKSKRKIPLTLNNLSIDLPLKQRLQKIQNICKGHQIDNDYQISQINQWIYDQYFISNCDKEYYNQTQMKYIINQITAQKQITFQNFKLIKNSLPKTKLFTNKIITKHQNNLQNYRSSKRKKMFFKKPIFNLDEKKIPNLHTGDSVWAIHPICQHLHSGNILAQYKQDIYMIKFNKTQLGTYKIPDYQISSLFLQSQRKIPFLKSLTGISTININIDHQVLASYLSFLQYKSQLINKVQQYNDCATKAKQMGMSLSQKKLQQYGWLGSQITLINMVLKHYQINYPLSLTKPIRNQKLPKLPTIYPNSQYIQINTVATISDQSQQKKNEQKQKQLKSINQSVYIQKLCKKFSQNLIDQQVVQITKNLFGILIGLNQYKLQQKYMTQLKNLIGQRYPKYYNSILNSVLTISKY